jgi:hypothetical protein
MPNAISIKCGQCGNRFIFSFDPKLEEEITCTNSRTKYPRKEVSRQLIETMDKAISAGLEQLVDSGDLSPED